MRQLLHRALMLSGAQPWRERAHLSLADGTVEALKWLAFAAMVVDHLWKIVWRAPFPPWAFHFGRLAFPLFALLFAYNLARPAARGRQWRFAWRTLAVGLLAQPLYLATMPRQANGNILLTLGAGALLIAAFEHDWRDEARRPRALLVLLLVALTSPWLDYGPIGLAVMLGAYALWAHDRLWGAVICVGALMYFSVAYASAVPVGAIVLLMLATHVSVPLPRSGRLLLWLYPAHLALLLAFAARLH